MVTRTSCLTKKLTAFLMMSFMMLCPAEFPFWLKEAKEKGIVRDQEPPAEKPKKKAFSADCFRNN
ncbi:hypothetical protein CM50_17960 [Bacillus subtilis]|nr:hypothetical protein CM50_17960 [Bacillus subtilis] [Bacillus stercoris]